MSMGIIIHASFLPHDDPDAQPSGRLSVYGPRSAPAHLRLTRS